MDRPIDLHKTAKIIVQWYWPIVRHHQETWSRRGHVFQSVARPGKWRPQWRCTGPQSSNSWSRCNLQLPHTCHPSLFHRHSYIQHTVNVGLSITLCRKRTELDRPSWNQERRTCRQIWVSLLFCLMSFLPWAGFLLRVVPNICDSFFSVPG